MYARNNHWTLDRRTNITSIAKLTTKLKPLSMSRYYSSLCKSYFLFLLR